MSSYAPTMPDMPAPTMATSSPRRSWGIEPRPAGWVIQSSKGKGKSGPNIVTGRCALSAAEVNSFAMSAALHHLVHGNGKFYSQIPREPHVTHHYSPGDLRALGPGGNRSRVTLTQVGRAPGPYRWSPGSAAQHQVRQQLPGRAPYVVVVGR